MYFLSCKFYFSCKSSFKIGFTFPFNIYIELKYSIDMIYDSKYENIIQNE